MDHDPPQERTNEPSARSSPARLLLLLAGLGGLALALRASGLTGRLSLEGLRDAVQAAGPWGPGVFTAAFCLGELAHVPGLVFVGAALLVWGPLQGALLAYLAALASVSCTFLLVRGLGGQAAAGLRWSWARRALYRLERRPVATVAPLRAVLVLSPPLNYALPLTSLRFRDHLLGSALGLVAPLGVAALASGWVLERLS